MKQMQVQNLIFDPNKLKEARLARFPELSARRVAIELLEIKPQSLWEYEQGGDKPSPTTLARMCALYGVELLELTTVAEAA